jgi:FkbM family methyltransferase
MLKALKTIFRPTYHTLKVFPEILRENGWILAMRCLLMTALHIHRTIQLRLGGEIVYIRTSSTDVSVAVSCLLHDEFAPTRALQSLEYGFIIDAGGYIGTAAIALAKMFPTAQVVTLEPSHENFALTSKNTAPFSNITALNLALMPIDGRFHLYDAGTGEWGFTAVEKLSDDPTRPLHEIQGISVPTLLARFGKSGVDIVKLDIEGGEKGLLAGRPNWVGNTGLIIAELHDAILPGCREAFDQATVGMSISSTEGEKIMARRLTRSP